MRGDSSRLLAAMSSPSSNETTYHDVPATILESFLPGFGFIRRLLLTTLGFDVTFIVSGCLVLIGLFSGSKYLYRALSQFADNYLMSSVHIEPNTELYTQVMSWISANVVTERSRNLTAKMNTSDPELLTTVMPAQLLQQNNGQPFDFGLLRKQEPVMYAPHYGDHGFWHAGRYFRLHREKRDVSVISWNSSSGNETVETMAIKTFGFSPRPIQELLDTCKRQDEDRSRTLTSVLRPHRRGDMWSHSSSRPSRPLDTVYLEAEQKARLLQDATEFLHPLSRRFYASRGIPYRRGYLLYGEPGTGKTTISMTLAGYFGLNLCVLSLVESSMTDERLGALFAQLPRHCIVLLEDIDAAGLEAREEVAKQAKEVKDKEEQTQPAQEPTSTPATRRPNRRGRNADGSTSDQTGITLSGLLNALDGVASQEGRILIMTTNDPEALDKALVRPGRIDMQVYFGHLSKVNGKAMFLRMYQDDEAIAVKLRSHETHNKDSKKNPANGTLQANGVKEDDTDGSNPQHKIEILAEQFADMLPESTFTPAEVQGYLLTRRKSPEKAIAEFEAWRDVMMKAKERGTNIIATKAVKSSTV